MSCELCLRFGITCDDVGILFFKRRAIFVGNVQTHEGQPISECPAVTDNAKVPEVAKKILYEAGERSRTYTCDDYDPEL